jgi:hypothetical protein
LASNGAFLRCATCGYAITQAALSLERSGQAQHRVKVMSRKDHSGTI